MLMLILMLMLSRLVDEHISRGTDTDVDAGAYDDADQPSAYRLTIYRYANIVCFSKYR